MISILKQDSVESTQFNIDFYVEDIKYLNNTSLKKINSFTKNSIRYFRIEF